MKVKSNKNGYFFVFQIIFVINKVLYIRNNNKAVTLRSVTIIRNLCIICVGRGGWVELLLFRASEAKCPYPLDSLLY